ncbi:MAG: NAD(P)-dependent oxidoreductase [Motilibacteraceae bacterium]
MADVAVLGTGRMGAAMAARLAGAGHRVAVWNRTPATAQALVERLRGADGTVDVRLAGSAADAVAGADVVLSVLADGDVTRAVLLAPDVVGALQADAVVCDLGTSGVAAARALSDALSEHRRRFVDAPVSGSVPSVENGQLLVMASGTPEDVAAVEPVLSAFARMVAHVGPAGSGQVMKLAVNLVVHSLNSALSEALALATAAGVGRAEAYDIFRESVVGAPFVQYKRTAFLDPDAPVAMSLDLVAKDLRLVLALARASSVPLPATAAVLDEVDEACRDGFGSRDMASLSRWVEMRSREGLSAREASRA